MTKSCLDVIKVAAASFVAVFAVIGISSTISDARAKVVEAKVAVMVADLIPVIETAKTECSSAVSVLDLVETELKKIHAHLN